MSFDINENCNAEWAVGVMRGGLDGRLLAPEIEPRGVSFVKIPRDRLLCVGRALAWPTVAADLRRALLRAGRPAALVDQVLADLAPVWSSVERAQGRVEDELTWALLVVAADHPRRRAFHDRVRPICLTSADGGQSNSPRARKPSRRSLIAVR